MTRIATIGHIGMGGVSLSPALIVALATAAAVSSDLPTIDDLIEQAVADEVAEAKQAERQSLAELKAAFARAAQLRDQEYNVVRIKGKHGRVTHQRALRTNETRREGGKTYVKVLIPYNEIEERNARNTFYVTTDSPKPHMRKGVHLPVRTHEQWVREDRLSKVA